MKCQLSQTTFRIVAILHVTIETRRRGLSVSPLSKFHLVQQSSHGSTMCHVVAWLVKDLGYRHINQLSSPKSHLLD